MKSFEKLKSELVLEIYNCLNHEQTVGISKNDYDNFMKFVDDKINEIFELGKESADLIDIKDLAGDF